MRTALVALALVTFGCQARPAGGIDTPVTVSLLSCVKYGVHSVGTLTTVGVTQLTARHVAETCPGLMYDASPKPAQDYTIVKAAPLPSCRDAQVGEAVLFTGYPGTDLQGNKPADPRQVRVETDRGVVLETNRTIAAINLDRDNFGFKQVEGTTKATMTRVRPGYSGGSVISAEDGRLVGIINAINHNKKLVYFTPVSTICSKIEEITNE
jgi:hypothetical protein